MQDKKQLAQELHHKRYNCCQAVACVFAEEIGVDKEEYGDYTEFERNVDCFYVDSIVDGDTVWAHNDEYPDGIKISSAQAKVLFNG